MLEITAPPGPPRRRKHLAWLGYATLGTVLFAGFLISTFPYSPTLTTILAPMGLEFSSSGQTIHFPFGAQLSNVRVTSTTSPGGVPVLESRFVTIAPSILSLLLLHPGVRVKASVYGGELKMTARSENGGTAINFDLNAVNLAQQKMFATPGMETSGILSGAGKLWISPADIEAHTGDGQLNAAGLAIISAILPGPIRLGDAQTNFKLGAGTLIIENLKTSGGDLALTANGSIQLAPDIGQSQLEMEFRLTPAPGAASRLGFIFAMLPHPPGAEPYQLSGTLNFPRIS